MARDTVDNDLYVTGNLSCKTFTPPASSITDAAIIQTALIQATKLVMQGVGPGEGLELFGPTTTVAALTKTLWMAHAPGTLVGFGAWTEVIASGADRTITVDLQKSTAAGAYATVLSATVGFTNVSAVRTLVTGTILTAPYIAGDIFRAVISVAGAAGAQATGLSIKTVTRQNPA